VGWENFFYDDETGWTPGDLKSDKEMGLQHTETFNGELRVRFLHGRTEAYVRIYALTTIPSLIDRSRHVHLCIHWIVVWLEFSSS